MKTIKLFTIPIILLCCFGCATISGNPGESPKRKARNNELITDNKKRSNLLDEFEIFPQVEYLNLVTSIAFSHDGNQILTGLIDGTVRLWDAATGIELRTFFGHSGAISSVAFRPDGQQILSGSWDRTIKIWDANSGIEQKTFRGHTNRVTAVMFHNDQVLSGADDGTIKLWDIATGIEQGTFFGHIGAIRTLAFNPNGQQVLSGSWDGEITLWDINTDRKTIIFFDIYGVNSAVFSPDGSQILTGSDDGIIKLWDTATGKEVKTLYEHPGTILSVTFNPKTQQILTVSRDGIARLRNIEGEETASFISFNDGEWIVVTPDGFYNASSKGDQHFNVRIGSDVYRMNQFTDIFRRSEVVEAYLQGHPITDLPVISMETIYPSLVIKIIPGKINNINRQVELTITIEDIPNQIEKIEIYNNGRLVGGSEFESILASNLTITPTRLITASDVNHYSFTINLNLDPGDNKIDIIATSNNNTDIEREIKFHFPADTTETPPKGDLYITAVGVTHYVQNLERFGFNKLNYPADDADKIISTFKAQEGVEPEHRFDNIFELRISDNPDDRLPTRDNIVTFGFEHLRHAKPQDTIVLFLAGHGIIRDGIYYFLPRDTEYSEQDGLDTSSAISMHDLSEALDIPGRKILILDTCHSGGVFTNNKNTFRFTHSLNNRSTFIFASSQDNEKAVETRNYAGGVFTYAFIEGINGRAASEGRVRLDLLMKHVIDRVPKYSERGGKHTPRVIFHHKTRLHEFIISLARSETRDNNLKSNLPIIDPENH